MGIWDRGFWKVQELGSWVDDLIDSAQWGGKRVDLGGSNYQRSPRICPHPIVF